MTGNVPYSERMRQTETFFGVWGVVSPLFQYPPSHRPHDLNGPAVAIDPAMIRPRLASESTPPNHAGDA